MGSVSMHPEFKRLQEQYAAVSEHLSQLICVYDDMVLQQGPQFEARYVQTFGELDKQAYEAYIKVATLKRQIDLVQMYLNRGEEPDMDVIELTLDKELQTYQQELKRMAGKLAWSEAMMESEPLTKEESKQLKKLYHDMAKGLHPDLNPEQTEGTKALWHRVQNAYEGGDLPRLEMLYEIFKAQNFVDGQSDAPDALAELQQKYDKASAKVREYLEKIEQLTQAYPFKFEEMLRQPDEVERRQKELREQAQVYLEQAKQLEDYLALMMAPQEKFLH